MGRFANSWQIVKASGRVVRQDKELLVLPVLSFLSSLVIVLSVTGIGWGAGIVPQVTTADGSVNPLALLLAGLLYLGLWTVNIYFAAAVVAGAMERLAGGDPTLGSCLRAASRRFGRLFVWAAISATVSVVLQVIRERGGLVGQMFSFLGSMAWNLATFFVIPVLLFEDTHLKSAIGRSGGLFKKTWGETVIGTGGVSLVFGVAMMALVFLGVLLLGGITFGGMLWWAALLTLVVAVALLVALQSVFGGVYKAALYRYATTGQVAPGFDPTQVQGAFVPKAQARTI